MSAAFIVAVALVTPPTAKARQSAVQCKPAGTLQRVPELPEGSGLAAGRRAPDRFWSHNDSGDPVLFALDGNGRVTGRLTEGQDYADAARSTATELSSRQQMLAI